jgi:hypothetical protein
VKALTSFIKELEINPDIVRTALEINSEMARLNSKKNCHTGDKA